MYLYASFQLVEASVASISTVRELQDGQSSLTVTVQNSAEILLLAMESEQFELECEFIASEKFEGTR